jgi:hypothetical protein
MQHVKKFDEFLHDENPNVDPKKKPETGKADTTASAEEPKTDVVPTAEKPAETPEATGAEKPNTTSPDEEKKEDPKADASETPASDAADDANKKVEDETEVKEGNAFTAAMLKAKEEGLKEFEFNGRKYPIKEAKDIAPFGDFISENFTLYPSYNNMLGSEVLRNVPITHDVNMSVYGRAYVVDQNGSSEVAPVKEPEVVVVATVEESKDVNESFLVVAGIAILVSLGIKGLRKIAHNIAANQELKPDEYKKIVDEIVASAKEDLGPSDKASIDKWGKEMMNRYESGEIKNLDGLTKYIDASRSIFVN